MEREFIYTNNFDQKWKDNNLGLKEQRELELMLLTNPEQGAVISGTGGLRKVRFSPEDSSQGKRGAYRIIYLDIKTSNFTVLLLIYAKKEKDNIEPAHKKALKLMVEQLKKYYT